MPNENIETADMLVFLAVARTGSFGAAAKEMRLATPSVSARMGSLERKLQSALFTRTARGSSLTASGERFRTYARRCLDILNEAHHTVPLPVQERVMVAAPASLGAAIFAPVLRLLNSQGLAGHGRIADSNAVIDQLLDGSADVGFVVNGVVPSGIVARHVCRARIATVCNADHELARLDQVTLHDMLEARVAVYHWEAEAESLAELFLHPRRPADRPVQLLGLPSAALDLVAEAGYVGLVPEFALADSRSLGELVELDTAFPSWAVDVHLVHHRDAASHPGVRCLTENLDRISGAIRTTVGRNSRHLQQGTTADVLPG